MSDLENGDSVRAYLDEAEAAWRFARDSSGYATASTWAMQYGYKLIAGWRRANQDLASETRDEKQIAAVNADWSAYDKGLREAGKAVVEIADQYADHVFDDDLSEAFQALRSALSLVASEGE